MDRVMNNSVKGGGVFATVATVLASDSIPEKYKRQIDESIMRTMTQGIIASSMEQLAQEKQEAFGVLLEQGAQPQEIDAFLSENIDNYADFVRRSIEGVLKRIQEEV